MKNGIALRPWHPASKSNAYMRNKSFHKESICHGIPLCRIHNLTYAFKLADSDKQVNCKKCLKKMKIKRKSDR
jgi:hypothetical protein